eukprot:NODE_250_length_12902_cov_0.423182.p7 type:complete len:147 gc:universal NODE_250_length_12902_cov_0.423182:7314-6874(-)
MLNSCLSLTISCQSSFSTVSLNVSFNTSILCLVMQLYITSFSVKCLPNCLGSVLSIFIATPPLLSLTYSRDLWSFSMLVTFPNFTTTSSTITHNGVPIFKIPSITSTPNIIGSLLLNALIVFKQQGNTACGACSILFLSNKSVEYF